MDLQQQLDRVLDATLDFNRAYQEVIAEMADKGHALRAAGLGEGFARKFNLMEAQRRRVTDLVTASNGRVVA